MNNTRLSILIVCVLALVGAFSYFMLPTQTDVAPIATEQPLATYSNPDIGLEFDYRTGPSGYVLDERMPVDIDEELVRVIVIELAEDAGRTPNANSEGPPVISIAVFNNTAKQFPRAWADEHQAYSNINLLAGEVSESVVGGANAIRYLADGLYVSDNVVVAHGRHVYVITGQFLDAESTLRRDFAPLLSSMRFIPYTPSHMDATYLIEGREVKLSGGVAEEPSAPGSASNIVTRYFGNELVADVSGDGKDDVVFLLTQDGGGSGTFYYAVAAVQTDRGYVGSDGYFLGDRIAPQTTELSQQSKHKHVVVVNYAERGPGDPMTAPPTVGKSVYLKLDPASMRWGIVEPDFEGESR